MISVRILILLVLLWVGCKKQDASLPGSIDLVVHLVDEDNNNTAHLLGMSTLPQKYTSRLYSGDIDVRKIREFDSETIEGAWAYHVKMMEDGSVCFQDIGQMRIGCMGPEVGDSVRFVGNGVGRGPGEVNKLDEFDISLQHGAVLFDGSGNLVKYLDRSGTQKAQFVMRSNPSSAIALLNQDEIVSLSAGYMDESPFILHRISSGDTRADLLPLYPTLREQEPRLFISLMMFGFVSRFDDHHFLYASRYLGIFSVIHTSGKVIYTRSYIENNHGEPIRVYQRPEAMRRSELGKYFYDAPRERMKTWAYGMSVTQTHLVVEAADSGKFVFDFYAKEDGEYQFSYEFKEKEYSVMNTHFSGDKLAVLTPDGKIYVYQFDMSKAGVGGL